METFNVEVPRNDADSLITPKAVGGIANVFNSIQRLEAEETLCTNKMMLVDLKPVHGLGHLATEDEIRRSREGTSEPNNSEQSFFLCGASSHCAFVSPTHVPVVVVPLEHLLLNSSYIIDGWQICLNFRLKRGNLTQLRGLYSPL